jgi:hypothetical protein
MMVQDCLREADPWDVAPPTSRERDALMTRILALHVEVTRLERGALLGSVVDSAAPE